MHSVHIFNIIYINHINNQLSSIRTLCITLHAGQRNESTNARLGASLTNRRTCEYESPRKPFEIFYSLTDLQPTIAPQRYCPTEKN